MHGWRMMAAGAIALLTVGCDGSGDKAAKPPVPDSDQAKPRPAAPSPAPGGPAKPLTQAGPADVVRHYYALIGDHRYAEARALWSDGGKASGQTAETFAASFADVKRYAATVGAPGTIEGAAGSLYVTVPVEVTGEKADGTPIHIQGDVTLRRVNDVPGSTAEQRQWHISAVPG